MAQWRLIETGTETAAWNMAVDEALLRTFRPDGPPVLRLYGWEPALSFGRFSEPAASVDLDRMKSEGVACVRRMTGGGILVHGGDLSYSILLPASFAKEHGVKGSYRRICRFLIRLYEKLGFRAAFAQDANLPERRSDICLAGHEAFDIVIGGRKIGGNAQRHTRRAMLQHGSVPLRYDRALFEPLFPKASGFGDALSLEELGVRLTPEALRKRLKEAFRESFGADFAEEGLGDAERALAKELCERKYTLDGWNLDGKEPRDP